MTDHSVIGAGGIEENRNGDNRMAWAKMTRERFRDSRKNRVTKMRTEEKRQTKGRVVNYFTNLLENEQEQNPKT